MNLKTIILAALICGAPLLTHAQSGTFTIGGGGNVTFTPGSDITVATNFIIERLLMFGGNTGAFIGLSLFSDFGAVSFTPNSVAGLSFGNAAFGTFVASSDNYSHSDPTHADYELFGTYNSGSFDGGGITNAPASVDFDFALSGGNTVVSGIFSIPPIGSPVPEPGTMVLAALGGVSLLLLRGRK